MSYFLWIEDFENSPKVTANELLGSILEEHHFVENKYELKHNLEKHGIFVELNFQDGLKFIQENLRKVDYIILDIDLLAYAKTDEISADVLKLLETFQDYQKQPDENEDEALLIKNCHELKEIAGFYLYTELVVEQGFPKQHILFCSNHGENTKNIQVAFKTAKIELPKILEKSNTEVQTWVKTRYENSYSRLRRGIIEGCQCVKQWIQAKNLSKETLAFNQFVANKKKMEMVDVDNYLTILENFLPLREPTDKATWYKLFMRTLAHEWEMTDNEKLTGLAKLLKITRNWSAHGEVFAQLTEQDVAYLFLINLRVMFKLNETLENYEQHLFSLFENPLSKEALELKIGTDIATRKLPLAESYLTLLKKQANNPQESLLSFSDILDKFENKAQKNSSTERSFLIQGLYQLFWFLISTGTIPIKDNSQLNYQFNYSTYTQTEFHFELARHIYTRSFPETTK